MHAEFADLVAAVGEQSLLLRSRSSSVASPSDFWNEALTAASAIVDGVLRRCGHAVPVDYDAVPSDPERDGVRALLKRATIARAIELATPPQATEVGSSDRAFKIGRDILEDIRSGKIRLPLPITRRSVGSVRVTRRRRGAIDPAGGLSDAFFERVRSLL